MTAPLRYLSVCSGIEAATQAWHPLGWQPVAFSEIEPFPCAVLAHHYPTVPNLGDMTKFEDWPDADVDVLAGGTPCQSFSVAGLRKGLADPRGNLMLTYGAIAGRYRPKWLVWENVPGVLSSNGGRDFGAFLGMLGQLGYGFAYRVLDAQHVRTRRFPFAVPQRRRRVFVVGYLGDWRRAAAVLFDRESLSGHPPPRREAGKRPAPTIAARTRGGGGLGTDFDCDGGLILSHDPACTLTAREMKGAPPEADLSTVKAHALRGEGFDASEDGTGCGTPLVPISFGAQNAAAQGDGVAINFVPALDKSKTPAVALAIQERAVSENPNAGPQGAGVQEGIAYTLEARHHVQAAATPYAVRRLTPLECERLQGFPDIKNCVTIRVWSTELQKNAALAETISHRSQKSALIAEENASRSHVRLAAQGLSASHQEFGKHAAVHVLIDLERRDLLLRNLSGSRWSARIAESQNSSPLLIQAEVFARLLARMPQIQGSKTACGGVVLPEDTRLSSLHQSGSALVHLCGQEIVELARDAEMFTTAANRCMKFTTSEVGSNSLSLGMTWETWSCCVAAAISGFIPEQTKAKSSFDICIETSCGFTCIPWRGKPADQCPDGPRYKALGNSWAVNVAEWVGERIAIVDSWAADEAVA